MDKFHGFMIENRWITLNVIGQTPWIINNELE
jgi:hypothetical protein